LQLLGTEVLPLAFVTLNLKWLATHTLVQSHVVVIVTFTLTLPSLRRRNWLALL